MRKDCLVQHTYVKIYRTTTTTAELHELKKIHYTHNYLAVFDLGAKLSSKSTDLYFFEIYIGL